MKRLKLVIVYLSLHPGLQPFFIVFSALSVNIYKMLVFVSLWQTVRTSIGMEVSGQTSPQMAALQNCAEGHEKEDRKVRDSPEELRRCPWVCGYRTQVPPTV